MVEDGVEESDCFWLVMVKEFFDLVLENARRTWLLHPRRRDVRRRLFAAREMRKLSVSEERER